MFVCLVVVVNPRSSEPRQGVPFIAAPGPTPAASTAPRGPGLCVSPPPPHKEEMRIYIASST